MPDKIFQNFFYEIYSHFLLARSNDESIIDDQPRVEKLSLKQKGIGSVVKAERMASADSDLQLLGAAERGRLLQKQKKRRIQGREDDVSYELGILVCFISIILSYFLYHPLSAKDIS